MEAYELQSMIKAVKQFTVKETLVAMGVLKPFMTKAEAYRSYGRASVDRWIKEGLVKLIKDGSDSANLRINRMEIEAVSLESNRMTYLTTAERN